MIEEEEFERDEKEEEKKESEESEEEKEVGVKNSESFVNIENQKIEKKEIVREEADLRVRVEDFKSDDLIHPPVLIKNNEHEHCEEVCGKLVPAPMPIVHTDVKSEEVKKNEKVHLNVFPTPFDDGKPKVKMRDVTMDEDSTLYVYHPKSPWPHGRILLEKHFGGGLKLEGRRYSSLACLKPP